MALIAAALGLLLMWRGRSRATLGVAIRVGVALQALRLAERQCLLRELCRCHRTGW